MSESCTHNCDTCGVDCPSRNQPESMLEPANQYSHVKKVIGVVSGKGGVGKSLVTALLAVAMRREGYNTAVLDAVKAAGIAVDEENSSIGLVPNMTAPVNDVATAKAINKFVEMLENLEDVQDVYTNMETSDAVDAALEAEG